MMGSPQDHVASVLDVHVLVVFEARLMTFGPVGSAWALAVNIARSHHERSPSPSSPPAPKATASVAVTMLNKRGEALSHGG
jgi:hypothetical protein